MSVYLHRKQEQIEFIDSDPQEYWHLQVRHRNLHAVCTRKMTLSYFAMIFD